MSVSPPSTFASLFRRSKFASYDPHIGQVYTSYGGYAHRGDWGVKRPLISRKGYISLQNVDTLYQQSEWENAIVAAKWMKTFPEMSRPVDRRNEGSWAMNLEASHAYSEWPLDSDFTQKKQLPLSDRLSSSNGHKQDIVHPASIPNPLAMAPLQFKKYIKKLQKESPQFSKYMKEKRLRSDGRPLVSYEASEEHSRYLSQKNEEAISVPTSTQIRQLPHVAAGLSYSRPSEIELFFNSRSLPGRITQEARGKYMQNETLVAVGGFIGVIQNKESDGVGVTDFGTENGIRKDRKAGQGVFRSKIVSITRVPRVVGPEPEGIDKGVLNIVFRGCKTLNQSRLNPHRPGTREYIAWPEREFAGRNESFMTKKLKDRRVKDQTSSTFNVMKTLQNFNVMRSSDSSKHFNED